MRSFPGIISSWFGSCCGELEHNINELSKYIEGSPLLSSRTWDRWAPTSTSVLIDPCAAAATIFSCPFAFFFFPFFSLYLDNTTRSKKDPTCLRGYTSCMRMANTIYISWRCIRCCFIYKTISESRHVDASRPFSSLPAFPSCWLFPSRAFVLNHQWRARDQDRPTLCDRSGGHERESAIRARYMRSPLGCPKRRAIEEDERKNMKANIVKYACLHRTEHTDSPCILPCINTRRGRGKMTREKSRWKSGRTRHEPKSPPSAVS